MTTRFTDFMAYFMAATLSCRMVYDAWAANALIIAAVMSVCAIIYCCGMHEKAFPARPRTEA